MDVRELELETNPCIPLGKNFLLLNSGYSLTIPPTWVDPADLWTALTAHQLEHFAGVLRQAREVFRKGRAV